MTKVEIIVCYKTIGGESNYYIYEFEPHCVRDMKIIQFWIIGILYLVSNLESMVYCFLNIFIMFI